MAAKHIFRENLNYHTLREKKSTNMGKNKYGQYFTIEPIAEFMTQLITHDSSARVLEPSCGKGIFLHTLLHSGFKNITAYEIDNTLSNPYDFVRYESFISSTLNEKYDVIIGNPPYIRWKNLEIELKKELETNALWQSYFNSLCDYLFIFILKSIEQLEEDGELIFICTEYWMNTTNSKSLREYMVKHGYFSEIYHFKESPLFQGVTASFVIFRYIKSSKTRKKDIDFYMYKKKGVPSLADLTSLHCFDRLLIPQFSRQNRWILATQKTQDEINNFENSCSYENNSLFGEQSIHRIGDVCDIGNGMVSGLDAAFCIESSADFTTHEKECTIDVLKAKDLDAFNYKTTSKYIFLPENISEDELKINYPHFYKHFQPNIDKLNHRYLYNRDIPYWAFVFPRNKKLFDTKKDKIFIPCKERISNKDFFRFCFAPSGYYPLQDVTGIVKKDSCNESIEYILYFLNSKHVFNWLTHNGIIKGAIVEFSEAPIASIPYRMIDWNNPKEVAIHNNITKGVKSYIQKLDDSILAKLSSEFNSLFL